MRTGTQTIAFGWSSLFVLLYLAGCGGGGGGGGGGGLPALTYSGNTNQAAVTGTNASRLTANVFGSSDTAGIIGIIAGTSTVGGPSVAQASGGLVGVTLTLSNAARPALRRAIRARGQGAVSGVNINETEPCDGGNGSIRTTGTLSDVDGTGTLTITFNNCLIGSVTLNGLATAQVLAADLILEIPTHLFISSSRLTIRGPGISNDAGGSVRVQISGGTETTTNNLIVLNNLTGVMTMGQNLVFVSQAGTVTITGRIFDNVHGYVDVNTLAPLLFLNQEFPGNGQLLLTGSGNRSVRVTALSATMATLALDLNGDGTFESNATLKWTDLSGPVGADLADSDGDGMHNSWETANPPMNPNLNDAVVDNDGDGASNLVEYLAGSDPNNPGSTPPVVGLSLSVQDTPDPVAVGGNLTYSIVVTNSSFNTATNVVLTVTLPASVNLTSPLQQPTQGSCSGTTTITCNFGTLGTFGTASVVIGVTPTAEGLISNTASITTSSFDPNTSDNSATNTTLVGQPVTGIQQQIIDAIDGQTILVGPGLYFGGLNFLGKNVTLQSSDGPATTIITGSQIPGVQIGPLGAIKGFTITGGGIQAIGQGTLISGNIFDGNVSAGIGLAIGGNNASPIIERNIFRNISCGNPSSTGAIEFVNNSSPLIVNNIFENNPCNAISLSLPSGNTPQVINNTFVGNRTGVRIDRRVIQVTQVFRNNIIVQNSIGLEVLVSQGTTDADNPVWTNNLVFGNTTANYQGTADPTNTNGNISANPMFVNGAAGNYRLQAGSPAIDAGNGVGAPTVDFDGASRPLDGDNSGSNIWDIGAFEALP